MKYRGGTDACAPIHQPEQHRPLIYTNSCALWTRMAARERLLCIASKNSMQKSAVKRQTTQTRTLFRKGRFDSDYSPH